MKLDKETLQRFIYEVWEEQQQERKYDCEIISLDTEKELEKQKDGPAKGKEIPVVKTTKIQKCKLGSGK
tara:strand:+ start:229 stop:435 length:207 start_codon:yes stop_codon:yes gene_type:complete